MYKVLKNFTEGERRTSHNFKNPVQYTKNVTPGEKSYGATSKPFCYCREFPHARHFPKGEEDKSDFAIATST